MKQRKMQHEVTAHGTMPQRHAQRHDIEVNTEYVLLCCLASLLQLKGSECRTAVNLQHIGVLEPPRVYRRLACSD